MCVEMAMMMENFQQKSKRATTPSCWGGPLKKCDAWLLALSIYNHEVDSRFLMCHILFVLKFVCGNLYKVYLFQWNRRYKYTYIFWDFHANRLVSNKPLEIFWSQENDILNGSDQCSTQEIVYSHTRVH